jgi:small subunit ribosomal protein S1
MNEPAKHEPTPPPASDPAAPADAASAGENASAESASPPLADVAATLRDQAAEVAEHVKDTAASVVDQVKDTAGSAVEQVKESVGQVIEPVRDTAGSAVERVTDLAGPSGEPSEDNAAAADDIDAQLAKELAAAEGGVEQLMEKSLQESDPPAAPAQEQGDGPAAGKGKSDFHHQIVRGRISAIRGEDVFIDITGGLSAEGSKLQGVVPLVQFDRPPRMGAIMDFVVDTVDDQQGLVFLSREGAISLATWDQLVRGSVVEARVTKSNKGGLELEMVGGIRAFMPASQIDVYHVDDLEQFVGQKLEAVVQEIDRKAKKVLLSRRTHLENQKAKNREKVLKELEVGQEREGTVSSVVDFGAFVDLGGVDGLVHVTDLSHAHVKKPSDVVKAGDKVMVRVLKIEPEKNRIALGMKQVQPDPWDGVADRYTAGEQVKGRVTRTANFGAFIEVEEGVEGLLPMSEMSWKRIHKAEDVVKVGDVVQVAVLAVDPQKKRLTLSLKAAKGDPWVGASHKYARDSMVSGTVTGTTDFGAFVELEQGVEGLVHISELSDRRVGQVTDVVKVGDTKEFRIKDIDEDQRKMSLSLKPAGSDHGGGDGRGRGDQPVVKGPARKKIPKENLKSGLGNVGGTGLGGLSLDDFK